MSTDAQAPEPQAGDEILFGGKTKGWYRWAAWFAGMCFRSRMLPRHVENQEQALYILLKGEELGLKPTFAWDYLYPTKSGKLGIPKRAALAVVQACPMFGGYEERLEGEGDNLRGVAIATRKGFPPTLKEFTMKDAGAAGLLKQPRSREGGTYDGPWQSYLKDMLLARAAGRALNVAFAAELAGCLVEGEAEDADDMEERRSGKAQKALPVAPPRRDPLLAALEQRKQEQLKALPAPAAAPAVVAEPEVLDPALVKVIDQQVEEMWPREQKESGPPPAAQPATGIPAVKKPLVRDKSKTVKPTTPAGPAAGGGCSRCNHKLNAMGGCDVCGWPGADIR